MNTIECMKKRKSVRSYSGKKVGRDLLDLIMKAGLQAPSGKNGQPWRFYLIHEDKNLFRRIAEQTVYFPSVYYADCLLLVFLDKEESYHYIKDVQAIGACIENMLLAAEELGLGVCWNGEILRNEEKVKEILSIGNRYDLMAMLAIGYSSEEQSLKPLRKDLKEVLLGNA